MAGRMMRYCRIIVFLCMSFALITPPSAFSDDGWTPLAAGRHEKVKVYYRVYYNDGLWFRFVNTSEHRLWVRYQFRYEVQDFTGEWIRKASLFGQKLYLKERGQYDIKAVSLSDSVRDVAMDIIDVEIDRRP